MSRARATGPGPGPSRPGETGKQLTTIVRISVACMPFGRTRRGSSGPVRTGWGPNFRAVTRTSRRWRSSRWRSSPPTSRVYGWIVTSAGRRRPRPGSSACWTQSGAAFCFLSGALAAQLPPSCRRPPPAHHPPSVRQADGSESSRPPPPPHRPRQCPSEAGAGRALPGWRLPVVHSRADSTSFFPGRASAGR